MTESVGIDFQRQHAANLEQEKAEEPTLVVPTSNYKDKYAHLIGQDAALDAARKTESNKSYGFGEYFLNANVNPNLY